MISYKNRIFHAQTNNSSYIIRVDECGYLEQLYYGKRIQETSNYCPLFEKISTGYGNTIVTPKNPKLTLDNRCLEYSFAATGDYGHLPISLRMPDDGFSNNFIYEGYKIYEGTYEENNLTMLPHARLNIKSNENTNTNTHINTNEIVNTLDITLKDSLYPIYLHLIYTFFEDTDVIIRRVKIENQSETSIDILKVMSMMIDLPGNDYHLQTFDGLWVRERHENKKRLVSGLYVNDSTTGSSSNRHNPFIMISKGNCNQEQGECIGVNLIYSGNHYEAVEVSEYGKIRIMSGINSFQFEWKLQENESFYTPEAVLTYSSCGQNHLSQNMHKFIQNHIIPQEWAGKERPILINNWEATYFDFNESKILKIAQQAKKLGIEMLVLDDGWFGKRVDDTSSLGDWVANEKKLGGSLKRLAEKVNKLDLKFGLWFEPEMISEKSLLFEKHPDWAVKTPNREAYLGRNQLVLDLTRPEVRDYIVKTISEILLSASIEYVKWDMNRHISDAYSASLSKRQGEFYHRYIQGVYDIMKRITDEFPKILFESCSSGGNRFDLGMLYYMPQIWTSDNTDANERTHIQQGTSYGYPLSTMGAHISAVPNHQTLRDTSLETRFNVACFGVLGYEIDITKLSKAEKKTVSEQIKFYKKYRLLFQTGIFSRLEANENQVVWQVVSEDKKHAIILLYQRLALPNTSSDILKAQGLNENELYEVKVRKQYSSIKQFGNLVNQISPISITNEGLMQSAINKFYMLESEREEYHVYGDMIMNAGIKLTQQFLGTGYDGETRVMGDYSSRLYEINSISSK